ncbi:BamA/TamA family outer membrane protein [Croceitalea vernalis]|uniref:BamA/TamA family outer membrane protein n=1 Tax=Croceitalea vernalis TaxID=3075599 RepID=A0ABU3BGC1_9FLAO|nr:BamA/TamA family outer membrane protein [Croceitalea sp. P007]MDT0621218.1 BamA/TamA family outer membrane protein [Croceitalea sp. P007]
MKLLLVLKKFRAKIGLLLAMIVLASCNAIKKVNEDELLLTKNTVYADGQKTNSEAIKGLIAQKPNSTLLGYPLRLNLYNLAKDNPDSLYQDWLTRKEGRQKRLNSFLSEKQVKRLGESFVVRGYSNLFKRIGEPPAVIDSLRTNKTIERLKGYYGSKGYFNNSASYNIVPLKKKKRAEINYNVTLGEPYMIDSITKTIASKDLDSIYQNKLNEVLIKQDSQFDLETFTKERQRLTNLFRNSGIYNFQESSISYDISRDTSITGNDQKMDIQLNIKNLLNSNDSLPSKEYKVNRFEKIKIFSDYQFADDVNALDSLSYKDYTIYFKDKLKYKPKALTDAIFFEKDSIYRDLDYVNTNRQITNLNTFKYPSIRFDENNENALLVANVFLAPRPKYSLDTSLELSRSNIQQIGSAFSVSVITRNVFGGAETLSVSARGSVGLLDEPTNDEDFTSEIGGDINLTFPRIWFPFNTEKIIPYYMLPQTRLSAGTNFQKNLGLDRQTVNTVLSYNWSPTNFTKNTLELINIEFVRNTDPEDYFIAYNNTYDNLNSIADAFEDDPNFFEFYDENVTPDLDKDDEQDLIIPDGTSQFIDSVTQPGFEINEDDLQDVRSIEERRVRLTQNNLIFASNFTFQKNNREDINDNNFYQYRVRFESAGNLLSAFSNIIPFETKDGQRLVYGVPYSQYLKTDFDYIRHWRAGNQQVLAFHGFVGLALPYGNADNIPFVRSYFGGGANDNRAWNVYSLGPGRTQSLNDFNEANFKLAFNLEYRFPIVGDVKGALFADAGNIWNVFDNVEDEEATFNGFDSLADIALGTGFGLRYDFTYFVIRLDMGLKTHDPSLRGSKRWFRDYNFGKAVYNIGINYPF